MDLNILKMHVFIFFHSEKESIGSIQFNGKNMNMIAN